MSPDVVQGFLRNYLLGGYPLLCFSILCSKPLERFARATAKVCHSSGIFRSPSSPKPASAQQVFSYKKKIIGYLTTTDYHR